MGKLLERAIEEAHKPRFVSARVGRSYRAVGILTGSDEVVWFRIGPHEQYEKLLWNL